MSPIIHKKGVTLVELIAVIIVLGLAIPTLLMLFSQVNLQSVETEGIAIGTFFAEELMEEIRSKQFEDPNQTPGFGPEGGESGRADYDDVDDFTGYSENHPSLGYSRSVSVEYAELNGNTWQQATSSPTDYKMIIILVKRTNDNAQLASLVVLVARH